MSIANTKCFVTALILLSIQQPLLSTNQPSSSGLVNISQSELSRGETVPLEKNWQFFWKTFLDPKSPSVDKVPVSIQHQFWNKHNVDGDDLPAIGFGTYRIQVIINPFDVGTTLGLYVRENNTASKFFIDGKEAGNVGIPGKESELSRGSWEPTIISFEAQSDTIDILVHVSNYEFRNGGLGRPVLVGSITTLEKIKGRVLLGDIFFIGIYFALGLYHLGIVVLRPQDRPSGWLSIVFMLWIARLLFSGNYTIHLVTTDIPLNMLIRIEYLVLYSLFISTILYFSTVYRDHLIPHTQGIIRAIGALFILTVALPDTHTISSIAKIFLMLIPALAILPFVALIRAARAGNSEARTTMFAAIVLFIGVLNDTLYTMDIISSIFIVPYAFLVFIIGQALIMARYHNKLHIESNKQARDKEVLLNEVHHRVRNNLNVVIALLRMEARKRREPERAFEALDESVRRIKAIALVHDRLYNTGNFSSIELKPYIQSLLREISYTLSIEHFDFRLKVENLQLDLNLAIPCGLILNELLTNTAKHAITPGVASEVTISMQTDEDEITLVVADNGPGIPERLYSDKTALGLHIVNMLTEQLGGRLSIENRSGAYVEVCFSRTA